MAGGGRGGGAHKRERGAPGGASHNRYVVAELERRAAYREPPVATGDNRPWYSSRDPEHRSSSLYHYSGPHRDHCMCYTEKAEQAQ